MTNYDPAGDDRKMWVGYEVEGRLLGVTTLFVADPTVTCGEIRAAGGTHQFDHIYFLATYWTKNYKAIVDQFGQIPVTFEFPVSGLSGPPAVYLLARRGKFWRFQFALEVTSSEYDLMTLAGPLDELRIDIKNVAFKNTVVPFTVTTRTLPRDYKDDQEVKI